MRAHLDVPSALLHALVTAGIEPADPGAPTVIAAPRAASTWTETLDGLARLFHRAKAAAEQGVSVVFVVSVDALLGRTGPLDAMAATGVVSAARTLALESKKQGAVVNCVATAELTPPDETARWIIRLLEASPDGPTGELIQLGGGQVGKALS